MEPSGREELHTAIVISNEILEIYDSLKEQGYDGSLSDLIEMVVMAYAEVKKK